MTTRSLPHALRRLIDTYQRYDVEPPAVVPNIEALITAADKADAATFDTTPVEAVAAAALLEGRDPLTDKAVHAAIVGRHLATLASSGALGRVIRGDMARAARDNLDDLVAALQPAFGKAGATFTEAHGILTRAGIEGLTDPRLATASLPIAEAGVTARQADATLRAIAQAVTTLAVELGARDGTPIGARVEFVDATQATAADLIRDLPSAFTPWAVATAGHTLSLATPAEVAERYARAYQRERDVDAHEAARRAERPSYI
ncbi:hypothetical protein UB45_17035 [Terrabacter sp. 28]|nr:hypothetical protein UB45_17035 [Terrabacter sp. 28]